MKAFSIGKNIIRLEKTDSTNTYASTLLMHGNPADGTVIMTRYQEVGKGQRGAVWQSNPNENILLSIILYPDFLPLSEQFRLNQSMALGVCDCVQGFIEEKVKIKWPNDIYIGGKKAGGMLIENNLRGHIMLSSVVGIGININQTEFDKDLIGATSLKAQTGVTYELDLIAANLFRTMNNWYKSLITKEYDKINDRYQSVLFWMNEKKTFRIENDFVNGTIRGVNKDGKLIFEREDGEFSYFNNKEIEYSLR